jgi:hypothetical protein
VLTIHGDKDRINPFADGRALAKLAGGQLVAVAGGGHFIHARKPVQVNLALRKFAEESVTAPRDPTVHHRDGRPRALYASSPIGPDQRAAVAP